jgi:hypothetical protein
LCRVDLTASLATTASSSLTGATRRVARTRARILVAS